MVTAENFQYQDYATCLIKHAEGILEKEKVRDMLFLSQEDYDDFFEGKHEIDCIAFANFASELGFSLDTFHHKQIDFNTIKEHVTGNVLAISEKYIYGANSKILSFSALLNQVEKICGENIKDSTLRYLQLHPELLNHHEQKINYKAFDDTFEYLIKRGLDKSIVEKIGISAVNSLQNSEQFIRLKNSSSVKALYEEFFTDIISKIEENNIYKVTKVTSAFLEVESHENPKMLDLFKVKNIGKSTRCTYRAGIIKGLSSILKNSYSEVVEEKCVHHGDKCCVFKIYF